MRWEATIKWKDDGNIVEGVIFSDEDPKDNGDVFFYVDNESEMETLIANQGNGEDFILLSYQPEGNDSKINGG